MRCGSEENDGILRTVFTLCRCSCLVDGGAWIVWKDTPGVISFILDVECRRRKKNTRENSWALAGDGDIRLVVYGWNERDEGSKLSIREIACGRGSNEEGIPIGGTINGSIIGEGDG